MRSLCGKLGALSHKINPLGAFVHQNHHATDTPRDGNNDDSQQMAPQIPTESVPTSSRWSFHRSRRSGGPWSMKQFSSSPGELDDISTNKSEIRTDVKGDESSNLLGEMVMAGNLTLAGKGLPSKLLPPVEVSAKLTTKTFIWGLHCLSLDDVVAVTCSVGSQHFTIHSYALVKPRWIPGASSRRCRTDLQFRTSSKEEALRWATAFGEHGCHVNALPSPPKQHQQQINGSPPVKEQVVMVQSPVKCCPQPVMLVVINPLSGQGRALKVFHSKVQPIFELAGIKLTVVETTHPHHAQTLASTVELSKCPDGIICVGGDGIVNEVINGLSSRDDVEAACTIPIGIIPAGSDNSLVWTVLGIRDPIAAALMIVKGGMVAVDVFGVEWTKTGAMHIGLTVAYYGFMSDVLELSAKYQRRCGRLRYFVAGVLRLLCLSHYTCEVHYLPALSGLDAEHVEVDHGIHNPTLDPGPLASSIDSSPILAAPTRLNSNSDFVGVVNASYEPSDYVRGLDGKTKRPLPRIITPDEETVTVSSASPSPRARTRSKSKAKSVGSTAPGAWREVTGSCLGDTVSTTAGTRWGPLEGMSDVNAGGAETDIAKSRVHFLVEDEKWESRGGPFLGVMMCNHQCKTVQCIQSQALAPPAEHDDGNVHLLLVHNVGRLQLLRFFILMQFGRHISLPFVECIKARAVWLNPSIRGHQACGIDGELLTLDGPIMMRVLPHQCHLIGKRTLHTQSAQSSNIFI